MSIRMRLFLSHFLMWLVLTGLLALAGVVVRTYLLGIDGRPSTLHETVDALSRTINSGLAKNPDYLLQAGVLTNLSAEISPNHLGLVLRRELEVTFVSRDLDMRKMQALLDGVSAPAVIQLTGYISPRAPLVIARWNMHLSDGTAADLLLLTARDLTEGNGLLLQIFVPVLILLLLGMTTLVLTYGVSRSLIKPLAMLEDAAGKIERGELDFSLTPRRRDEIGNVVAAFEQMRIRLKDSLERQVRYEENRKELIANISHDLRTPVTAITGYLDGIRDGIADSPEKIKRYLAIISSRAEDLSAMIDELFLFSEIDLGDVPFHYDRLDLRAFVRDVCEEEQYEYEKRGARIEMPASGSEISVLIDPGKLRRVIANILENSLKYGNGGELTVRVSVLDAGHEAIVRISDNGPGIRPDALPHIFERFYRGDASRSQNVPGSGLGLAIAKRIVEKHGGSIAADTTDEQGATIVITLRKDETDTAR